MTRYYCKCGLSFEKAAWLREHIALMNPRYPRPALDDEHGPTTLTIQSMFCEGERRG